MASSTSEQPPSSSVTMEAKMIVATSHGHCQQLKDMLLSKEDGSTMVVVVASSNKTSMPPKPPSPAIDYRLLAAACSGSFEDLESLLEGQDRRQTSGNGAIGSSAMPGASDDEEAFLRQSLLDGVTSNGDTLLHMVATNGDSEDFLNKAGLIHRKAEKLLFTGNNKGDTPLHCAARAANSQMVSFLIALAKGQDNNANRVKALLEKENKIKETVLHEAVRVGNNDIVKLLMEEHPQLASLPKGSTSPLYLAILLANKTIANTLYEMSGGILSYSGPNGQNALHAAVLRGKDLTKMLLDWKKADDLAIQRDEKGNTPLHFAASVQTGGRQGERQKDLQSILLLLLKANPDALYQQDNNGLFPVHVAASIGANMAIIEFHKKSPTCVGLRDARGRTFLHVAVDKKEIRTVSYACRNRSLSWILNMQDKDGNNALHLAVQAGSLTMFCSLLGNRQVNLDLTNEKGETPLDMAHHNLQGGLYNLQNSVGIIHFAFTMAGAKRGIYRRDYFEENDTVQAKSDEILKMKMEKVKDETQILCIGSVLIATVTFGATFAMPGGYGADDQTNGGTPTLAGRYAFDAFTIANALAFAFSMMATVSLTYSGSPLLDLRRRRVHLGIAFGLMEISVSSLIASFTLGTYLMLTPVAHKTAVAVCVLSSIVLAYQYSDKAFNNALLVTSLRRRKGICSGIVWTSLLSALCFVWVVLIHLWPIVFIFCLTAAVNH